MSEFYEETLQELKPYSNRYKNCKILRDLDTQDVLLSTREIKDVPLSANDIYHTVTSNEENRLDLIAFKYYGNSLFWWVLAQANNIYDVFTKPVSGDIIRIPSLTTFYGNNGILL